jgi:hypothetical protein
MPRAIVVPEEMMAQRAGSSSTEIDASRAVFMSQPHAVADMIEAAAHNRLQSDSPAKQP